MAEERTLSATGNLALARLTLGRLRVLRGPDKGRSCELQKQTVVVGTAEDCALVLTDPKVSKHHCEVSLGMRGFLVKDLDSRNGTVFAGSKVRELAVAAGAVLRIGDTDFVVESVVSPSSVEISDRNSFGALFGSSVPMRRSFAMLERAAASDSTVLIMGETGTGKELAAQAIHDESARKNAPFETLDCAAIAPTLIGSELFGHERGAFTGATTQRPGAFERANNGTLFIDEIGELEFSLQPSLLRAVESGEIRRLGGQEVIRTNARLIAATRRDLVDEVKENRFREDLYFRLNVVSIVLPPLRERLEDLPILCDRILRSFGLTDPGPIDEENLAILSSYAWPGNVRELRNWLERASIGQPKDAKFRALQFEGQSEAPAKKATTFGERKQRVIELFEKQFLSDLLRQNDNNIRRASRESGIERMHLKRLLKKHDLLPSRVDDDA